MERFLEFLFGVSRDPTAAGVERYVDFNPPHWMTFWQFTPRIVNALLVLAALAVVAWVYYHDGRRKWPRIGLGILRALVLAYVIVLVNRPVLKEVQSHTEPSVLAILVDDSISMMIRDVNGDGSPTTRPGISVSAAGPAAPSSQPATGAPDSPTRLAAAIDLLSGEDQALLKKLAKTHTLRFYAFDTDARALGSTPGPTEDSLKKAAAKPADKNDKTPQPEPIHIDPKVVESVRKLTPDGKSTQVIPSLLTVLDDLQGQRLAGVVIITDARETPTASSQATVERFRKYPVKIYPVPVGSEKAPTNLEMVSLSVQDSAFKDDIVAVKVQVRGTGYEPGKTVRVKLLNKGKNRAPLRSPDGQGFAEKLVTLPDDRPVEEEILFKPEEVGVVDVEASMDVEAGELDDKDNTRQAQVAVLDAKINVLYVDGYPRWEYRYIKNEMIRDKTVNISCLLTSASEGFIQEGDRPDPDGDPHDPRTGSVFPGPVSRFPESMDELMKYDVVLFGDVDPRQFTDPQLQMVSDFVNKKGGGFGMVAGPHHSPIAYRNSAIEAVLPVNIARVLPDDPSAEYKEGFRPVVTDEGKRGEASTIFRFFADKAINEKYLREDLQPIFWYCRGISAKPGVGLVYAEHPFESDPNTGRKAPLLVLGRFGAGRTLFSAIDDSWRWRYYTGESVFDTYWVQQLRYLARSKKLGQRRVRFNANRSSYELGDQIKLELRVLDPVLLTQVPPQLRVDIVDEKGVTIRQEAMQRQETPPDTFSVTFAADRVGRFTVKLPGQLADAQGQQTLDVPIEVIVPRLELSQPQLDRQMLTKLAPPDQIVPIAEARAKLPEIIKSAARTSQVVNSEPLWNKWRALGIFVLLITTEWVLRKTFGMI